MRSLVCLFLALSLGATKSYAEKPAVREPFQMHVGKLAKYLDLSASQREAVENICDYFQVKQRESLEAAPSRKEAKMKEAIYGNLKLMKQSLTTEQYRKYVTLLNVTYNNRHQTNIDTVSDVYLASED